MAGRCRHQHHPRGRTLLQLTVELKVGSATQPGSGMPDRLPL